jgi:hypothetical protein
MTFVVLLICTARCITGNRKIMSYKSVDGFLSEQLIFQSIVYIFAA